MKTVMMALFACSTVACVAEQDSGAVADDSGDEAVADQDIIGGVTDTGDPCVLAVFAHAPGATSGSLCTCTVTAAHTCLTAAHCVDPRVVGTGQVFELLSGTTLTLPGIVASSTTFQPAWNPANLGAGHDIGIVHTANALPFPTCARGAFNPALPLRLVGYGSNTHTNTGAGTKRQVTVGVVGFNALLIQDGNSNMQTCHGDSGGPAFQTINGVQTVVGVTSFGQDQPPQVCFGGGFHVRVDADTAFINANTF